MLDQPGKVVWVPVEVQPPRSRNASMSSMMNGGTRALSPANELAIPRPLSTTSKLTRLKKSLSALDKNRPARSGSPRSIRYPRTPKKSFGFKSPATSVIEQTTSDSARSCPLDVKESHSRQPPLLRQSIAPESSSHRHTALSIPNEMVEGEIEDDYNFATQLRRLSVIDNGFPTALSPPSASSQRAPLVRQRTATDTSKPLPRLPKVFLPSPMPSQ